MKKESVIATIRLKLGKLEWKGTNYIVEIRVSLPPLFVVLLSNILQQE